MFASLGAQGAQGSGASSSDEDALFDCVVCLRDVRTLTGASGIDRQLLQQKSNRGGAGRRKAKATSRAHLRACAQAGARTAHRGTTRAERAPHTRTRASTTRAHTHTAAAHAVRTR